MDIKTVVGESPEWITIRNYYLTYLKTEVKYGKIKKIEILKMIHMGCY
jgi:hypothetical protein